MKLPFLSEEESWALTLTTFAGLSTSVGAAFAVSLDDHVRAVARRKAETSALSVVHLRPLLFEAVSFERCCIRTCRSSSSLMTRCWRSCWAMPLA